MKKTNLFNFANQYYQQTQIRNYTIVATGILLLTIISATIVNIRQFLQYKKIKIKNEELELSIKSLQSYKLDYNNLIQNDINNFNTPAKIIHHVTSALPSYMNLLEININDNIIIFKGNTHKHEQIIELIKNIDKNIFKINKVDIKNNSDSTPIIFEIHLSESKYFLNKK